MLLQYKNKNVVEAGCDEAGPGVGGGCYMQQRSFYHPISHARH